MIPSSTLRAKLEAFLLYNGDDGRSYVWKELESMGVDYNAVLDAGYPVVHRNVCFLEDGSFEYDELGEAALCLVALAEDSETETDIVAFSAKHPHIFGTLLRQAAVVGADRVVNPASYTGGAPCPLWRSPLEWLLQGTVGGVVIDPIPAALIIAKAHGKLAAEDFEHARELIESGAVRLQQLVIPTTIERVGAA